MLRWNNTTKILLITFFSNLYFYNHVGTLYFQSRGLSLVQVSSITAIIVATIFLTEVPTGVIADKIGRKWAVVMALLFQVLGEIIFLFASTYAVFVLTAIIAGVGFAFASGATESLVYDTLPPEDRDDRMKKAMGRVGSAYNLAFFLAPLVGGLLVTEYVLSKYLLVIAMTACSVAVALLVSFTLKEPPTAHDATGVSPLAIFRAGAGELYRHVRLRHILLVTIFTSTFLGVLASFYQPHFVTHGLPPLLVGAGLSLGGLLAAVTQRYAYRLQEVFGERNGLLIATTLPGVLYIAFALVAGAPFVFVVFILTYATLDLKKPLLSAYQNRYISDKTRATTLSLINMLTSLYVAVLAIVYGAMADQSLPLTFLVMGLVIVLAGFVLRVDKIAVSAQSS